MSDHMNLSTICRLIVDAVVTKSVCTSKVNKPKLTEKKQIRLGAFCLEIPRESLKVGNSLGREI